MKFLGCLVGFSGVILVNLDPSGLTGGFTLQGEGAILAAAVAYATSSSMTKNYSQRENPVVLSGYQFTFGGIVLTIVGVLMGGSLTEWNVASILIMGYLALLSSVAYTVWGILLKYNPVGKVTIYSFFVPMSSTILSFFILKESSSFGPELAIALVLVCAGIYLVNRVKE